MGIIADLHKDIENGALQLLVEYRGRLFSEAVKICHDEGVAEDLVFRTLEQVLRKADLFKDGTNLFGWMKSIMTNLHRNDLNRPVNRGTQAVDVDELERYGDADWSSDEQILKNSDSEAIRKAIAELDPKYNQVLMLRYYEELSLKQIAAILRLPLGTVCRRAQIAHRILAGKLGAKLGKAKKPMAVLAALCLAFGSFAAWRQGAFAPIVDWLSSDDNTARQIQTQKEEEMVMNIPSAAVTALTVVVSFGTSAAAPAESFASVAGQSTAKLAATVADVPAGGYRVSLDGGQTWEVKAATELRGPMHGIVELLGDCTFGYNDITFDADLTIRSTPGARYVLTRTKARCFKAGGPYTLTFENVIVDGGAVWTSDDIENLESSSGIAGPLVSLKYQPAYGATFEMGRGAEIRNVLTEAKNNAAVVKSRASQAGTDAPASYADGAAFFMREGAKFTDCRGGALVSMLTTSNRIEITGGEVTRCRCAQTEAAGTADKEVGLFNVACGTKLVVSGGVFHGNSTGGGVFHAHGYVLGFSTPLYVSGGVITNNVADGQCAGFYCQSDTYPVELYLSGSPVVADNKLKDGTVRNCVAATVGTVSPLQLAGRLTRTSRIGLVRVNMNSAWEPVETTSGATFGAAAETLSDGARASAANIVNDVTAGLVGQVSGTSLVWTEGTDPEGRMDISSAAVTMEKESMDFDGTPQVCGVASVILNDPESGEMTLVEGEDYTVGYENNVSAGTAKAIVAGVGDYYGQVEAEFSIVSRYTMAEVVAASLADQAYTGYPAEPALTLTLTTDKTVYELVKGRDYTVTYADNGGIGNAKAIVCGLGTAPGEKAVAFKIVSADIASATVIGLPAQIGETTEQIRPDISVAFNGKTLVKGTDYTVTYGENVVPGEGTVTLDGVGNFSGTRIETFEIVRRADFASEAVFTVSSTAFVTDPDDLPQPTFVVDGFEPVEWVDYFVTRRVRNNRVEWTFTAMPQSLKLRGTTSVWTDIVEKPAGGYRVSLDGGRTWEVKAATELRGPMHGIVELLGDCTFGYNDITFDGDLTLRSTPGTRHVLTRTKARCFKAGGPYTLTFENVIVDGGAVWTSDDIENLESSSGIAGSLVSLKYQPAYGATFEMGGGAEIRNVLTEAKNHSAVVKSRASQAGTDAPASYADGAAFFMREGAKFTDCRGGALVSMMTTSNRIEITGGEVTRCRCAQTETAGTAAKEVGLFNVACGSKLVVSGGVFHGNSTGGGVFHAHGYVLGFSTPLYVSGGVITNNVADGQCAGFYCQSDTYPVELYLSGSPVVADNKLKDGTVRNYVVAATASPLQLSDKLTRTSRVGLVRVDKNSAWEPVEMTRGAKFGAAAETLSDGARASAANIVNDVTAGLVCQASGTALVWTEGTKPEVLDIAVAEISGLKALYSLTRYPIRPKPIVMVDGRELAEGEDYVLEYDEVFLRGGNCKVTIKGVGDYSGSVNASYCIQKNGLLLIVR